MLCFGAFGYVSLRKIFYLFFMFDILRKLNQYKIFNSSRKITIKNKKFLKIFVFYETTFAYRSGDKRGVGRGPGPFKKIVFPVVFIKIIKQLKSLPS